MFAINSLLVDSLREKNYNRAVLLVEKYKADVHLKSNGVSPLDEMHKDDKYKEKKGRFMVKYLLEKGAMPSPSTFLISEFDEVIEEANHTDYDMYEVVNCLPQLYFHKKFGKNLNKRFDYPESAIFIAVYPEVIEYLIYKGACVDAKNRSGITLLHQLCDDPSNTTDIITVLLKHGANPNKILKDKNLMCMLAPNIVDLLRRYEKRFWC